MIGLNPGGSSYVQATMKVPNSGGSGYWDRRHTIERAAVDDD